MLIASLKNKGVVITGGSKGIGQGLVKAFISQGAKVLIISRDVKAAREFIANLAHNKENVFHYAADITIEEELHKAAEYSRQVLSSVDIVIANAGCYPPQTLEDMSVTQWDNVLDVNLKGTFLTVKTFIPFLKQAEFGRIILISSITGPITGYKGWSHYGASKAGQLGFMHSAALELAAYNITVNAILPGNILTQSLKDMGSDYVRQMAKSVPLKRLGTPDDIGNAALFLASREAEFITGQKLIVDGGQIIPESLDAF